MKEYEIGIKPTKGNREVNKAYILENREKIIYQLVMEYIDSHAGILEEKTIWDAFKNGEKVICHCNGHIEPREVYIHSIQSWIETDTGKVQTRYTICDSKKSDEFKEEYKNGLTICQQGDLKVINKTGGDSNDKND